MELLENPELLELLEEWDPEEALPVPLEQTAEDPES